MKALWPCPDPASGLLPGDPPGRALDLTRRGCLRCAEDHGPHLRPATCPRCRNLDWVFRRVIAARSYEPGVRRYLLRLKEGSPGADPAIAAAWLAPLVAEEAPDLLLPVPNTFMRQLRRGVNSAERLTRELAVRCGLPWSRVLGRRGWRSGQRGRDVHDRRALSAEQFVLRASVAGKRLALVDDVFTTGATSDACSRVLVAAGAVDVCVVVVARQLATGQRISR